jgi:hypothetical protein
LPVDRKPKMPVGRVAIGLAVALVMAVATFLLTLPFAAIPGAPALFQTADQRVAALTAQLGMDTDPARLSRQTAEAKAIVAHDATNVGAVRSLAVLTTQAGQPAQSVRLLQLAERLSRRDAPTQLALIELAVARGDIGSALRHYDRALTTKPSVADTLIPILVSASSGRPVAHPLARMMARRPVWWPNLLDGLIASGDPAPTAQVTYALALRPEQPLEGWRLSAVIDKLAKTGNANAALLLARRVRPVLTGQLVNGDFEKDGNLPPFDWKLIDSEGLAAVREEREGAGGRFALSLLATPGKSGPVVRQLLLLQPGRYRIDLRSGALSDDPAGRPHITMRCAANAGRILTSATVDRAVFSAAFTIPSGCTGQWLEFSIGASPLDDGKVAWIDDVSVKPVQ